VILPVSLARDRASRSGRLNSTAQHPDRLWGSGTWRFTRRLPDPQRKLWAAPLQGKIREPRCLAGPGLFPLGFSLLFQKRISVRGYWFEVDGRRKER
jgi:hypothetical protein